MRFDRLAVLLLILGSTFLSCPIESAQTSPAACDGDPGSALVFVGILTDVKPVDHRPQWNSVKFSVTELLRGEKVDAVTALMMSGLCADSTGVPSLGGTYLVQMHTSGNGNVGQLQHCAQITPLDQAAAELSYLRASQMGGTPTEVSGEVRVETHGFPWKESPLPGTKIHLRADEQKIDLVSDEDGHFQQRVKPGRYALTAEFPSGYEGAYCGPSTINVTEHRCTQILVCAHPTASFEARIVDMDGEQLGPLSSVQLTLETADDQQFVRSVWPDKNSDLVVDQLVPGRYILGLNTYLPVSRGLAPYPPTYFPGVSKRSEAKVISVGVGEHKVLEEMRIKRGQECEISVLVVDETGKPAGSAEAALAYRDYPHFYITSREPTDEKGQQSVYAVFPGPVLLSAQKQLGDSSVIQSDPVEVDSCPAKPVILKLNHVLTDASKIEKR